MQSGRLIVLEGGEGVGKSTQRQFLESRLPELFPSREFMFTREPGGTPLADKIRALVLSEDAKHADGLTCLGLFIASRADHVAQLVKPALEAGKVVVCDRYLASTYAYQIVAQERPELREFFFMHAKLVPTPDLTLFLDMDPAEALKRVESRAGSKNHFDARGVAFHERIRTGFTEFFGHASDMPVAHIDAAKDPEAVWEDIKRAVEAIL